MWIINLNLMNMKSQRNKVRIIGGKWRGRRLSFPSAPGLRPSPDRVRETLFNWLAADVVDVHCLDLFAGSGALGFEALSRGAEHVVMVDQDQAVTQHLEANAQILQAKHLEMHCSESGRFLSQYHGDPFDIVFLDPPFQTDLLELTIKQLSHSTCLAKQALVYIETATILSADILPDNWKILKSKQAGDVKFYLIGVNS